MKNVADWLIILERNTLSIPPILFKVCLKKYANYYSFDCSTICGVFKVDNKLYNLPFFNTFECGWICLGEDDSNFEKIEDAVSFLLSSFWGNIFLETGHPSEGNQIYKKSILGNLSNWEKNTKMDKDWIPSIDDLIEYKGRNFPSTVVF